MPQLAALPAILLAIATPATEKLMQVADRQWSLGAKLDLWNYVEDRNPKPAKLDSSGTAEYTGTVEPRRILYGTLLVSGVNVIPPWCGGAGNAMLDQILVVAGHPISAMRDVYLGQELIASANIGAVTGTTSDGLVTTGSFANRVWIRRYNGTQTSVDYILHNKWPSYWTTAAVGYGLPYIALQFQWDQNVYRSGKPDVKVLCDGKICYDPRLDPTPGASPNNPSYRTFTNNVALCIIDFLLDTTLAIGEDATRIDWTLAVSAANTCDENVAIPGSTTQKRFTCNVLLDATAPFDQNIATLSAAMMGATIYSGGKWRLLPGIWRSPSFTVNDADLVGPMTYDTDVDYQDRWNAVRGQFYDPNQFYQPTDYPPVRISADETTDNDPPGAGGPLWRELNQPTCTNTYEAQRAAIITQRLSRRKKSWIVPASYGLYKVRPGDFGTLNDSELGLSGKYVRCAGWKFDGITMGAQIMLIEADPNDYNDPATVTYQTQGGTPTFAPTTSTPDPLGAFILAGVSKGIQFNWTLPNVWHPNLTVDILEAATNDIAGASVIWSGVNTGALIAKSDFTTRYYWGRVRNVTNGNVSTTTPAGATSGVAGAATQVPTGDIAANAATVVAQQYTATQSLSGGYPIPITFGTLTMPTDPNPAIFQVTAQVDAYYGTLAGGNQTLSLHAGIGGTGYDATGKVVLGSNNASAPDKITLIWNFSYPGGNAACSAMLLWTPAAAGNTATANHITIKGEYIKL